MMAVTRTEDTRHRFLQNELGQALSYEAFAHFKHSRNGLKSEFLP